MYRISAYDRDGRQVTVVEAAGGEVTIGREADRQLVLPSPSVSRRHARIVLDGPQPFIADEGSANGVLVNGVRIGGPTALVPGVRIDVAEFWLDFAMAGQPASQGQPMQQQYSAQQQQQYQQPQQPAPVAVAAPLMRLRAQGGPFAGRAFEIPAGRVSIGRAIDNDLVFDDPSLSRKHSVVHTVGPDRIELQDLGSSNGTWVNGRKIESGVAAVGDAVRFGDLMFALEGDAQPAPRTGGAQDYNQQGSYGSSAPARNNTVLYAGIGVGALALAVGVTLFALRGSKPGGTGGGSTDTSNIAEQVELRLKAGKEKMADRLFDLAVAEFDRTLELDPTNGEARKLKLQAGAEPGNAKMERNITAKLAFNSRPDFETVVKMLGQIPDDSVFHDPTAQKVATRLVAFGDAQCKAKKYLDCAWAICKAIELAPAASRAQVVPSAAETSMHDAEKKAAREKGFVACKKK